MSLPTPVSTVEKLQTALQAKAKAAAGYRFYTLWDKVCRLDVLVEAYRRCRVNDGAPGVDGQTFEQIESASVGPWLAALQEELRRQEYRPQPLLRVWIAKSNGGQRPLGIPSIRDRGVQMAVLLVIGPIFEADLCDEQYGFRPGVDAKMAVRRVYFNVTERGLREVVDADLSDYFNTIPHGPLMRCLSRRIADGSVLSVVKRWLQAPVVERQERGEQRTTVAADTNRGTPQGGVASPLLANPVLPALRSGVEAVRSRAATPSPCGQLRGRSGHLLPTRFRAGGDGHLPQPDHPAGSERERAEDSTRVVAGGVVRLPRLHDRAIPPPGRSAVHRHPAVEEVGM
jgi:retron-type reverse transcriptase